VLCKLAEVMTPQIRLDFLRDFARTPASVTMGYVRVEGLDCSSSEHCAFTGPERLDWPPESPFAPYCP
jgi:hypothetical protein